MVVTNAAGDHTGVKLTSVRCTKSKTDDKLFIEYAGTQYKMRTLVLYYIALHCNALHCTALHCIVYYRIFTRRAAHFRAFSLAGGFTSSKKSKVQQRRLQMTEGDAHTNIFAARSPQTTSALGLATHRSFLTFTLFCQGLFAGVALWHMISVQYYISHGNHILLRQYGKMAKPLESLYYLMFALCIVAAFDRNVGFISLTLNQRTTLLLSVKSNRTYLFPTVTVQHNIFQL